MTTVEFVAALLVVTAGATNVAFTRMPEMRDGVPITAPDGTPLGTSKAAARTGVVNTIASRILLQPIAPMLFPPLMTAALHSVVPLGAVGGIVAQTVFVATCSGCALPLAIAIFPQEIAIPTSALEPEFQGLVGIDGQGYVVWYHDVGWGPSGMTLRPSLSAAPKKEV